MELPAIVIVAFNRPKSLTRLLGSIVSAEFIDSNITLIISIDKSNDNSDVLTIAEDFKWENGTKKIFYQPENLGLRKHIIQCMKYASEYGSMILLEDDLFVSPNFYNYSQQALQFSVKKKYIGGISLYNHQINVHASQNFHALDDGYDNYYFQFASSWGQAWSKNQINNFLAWYKLNPDITKNENIPLNVRSWSDKSWLKYHISYLIENNLYFLYPKISLTSNFGDQGTHMKDSHTYYQVPILNATGKEYNFSTLEESKSKYDAFFENLLLSNVLSIDKIDLTVDLYGYKTSYRTQFLLTSKILNFKIISSFSKKLKPLDNNIVYSIPGNEIFLYDTSKSKNNKLKKDDFKNIVYQTKYISYPNALILFKTLLTNRINNMFKKIFKFFGV